MTGLVKKLNFLARIQRWMDSVPGKTFMNYAYSWGAAIVILGTLFKLTHLEGADIMLFIGMGTEVIVFIIAGFDRPFDTEMQKEIAEATAAEEVGSANNNASGMTGGQTVIIAGGGGYTGGTPVSGAAAASATVAAGSGPVVLGGAGYVGGPVGGQPFTTEMEKATADYVEQLRKLTEVLNKVSEQSALMARESQEIEVMNRNLGGINAMYEMQLRTVSTQIGTIDEINAQNNKMAKQIEELNSVYARMLEAMTVNMNIKKQ